MGSADQVVEAFKADALARCREKNPGWNFFGELSGVAVPFEWSHLQAAPLGVLQWAEKCLSGRYRFCSDGSCTGCGMSGGPTWAAPQVPQHCGMAYCASCWNGFFLQNLENRKLLNAPMWADRVFEAELESAAAS